MPDKKECIVLIPVYEPIKGSDRNTIKQAVAMTPGMDKAFIVPRSFTMDENFADFENFRVERFDDSFFANIRGYNRLMLDVNFYRRFNGYKYMLIHQLDVYLFKPDLLYWCSKDYDYIGAPWLKPLKLNKARFYSILLKLIPLLCLKRLRNRIEHYNNVGNGGLSLRKTETFVQILESTGIPDVLNSYFKRQAFNDSLYNEDVFWSLEGPRLYEKFRKPEWREAICFSVEKHPSFAFSLMSSQLPFGCHKPVVHEPEFWEKHIPFLHPE